ncbi:serine palmitoyltransferase [Vigna unguiculata]|uniref:Serine palmitoyltransferase n=1 Tax=Vigna unguiculata TaxID=3917 RepID=A0A4D6LZM0_VIGUN|nr:serine palmitoyltransferase [Vigna unguiculata]
MIAIPYLTALTTYFSYGLLFAFGQFRDFFRKIFDWCSSHNLQIQSNKKRKKEKSRHNRGRERWSSRQVDLSLFPSSVVWPLFIYSSIQHSTTHSLSPTPHFPSSNTTVALSLVLSLTGSRDSGSDLRLPPHRETSFQTQNPDPSKSPHHDRDSVSHRVDHLLQLRLALRLRPVQGFLPQNLRLVQLSQSSEIYNHYYLFLIHISKTSNETFFSFHQRSNQTRKEKKKNPGITAGGNAGLAARWTFLSFLPPLYGPFSSTPRYNTAPHILFPQPHTFRLPTPPLLSPSFSPSRVRETRVRISDCRRTAKRVSKLRIQIPPSPLTMIAIPYLTALTTYFSYGLLFAFGQFRDFFRKIFDWCSSHNLQVLHFSH